MKSSIAALALCRRPGGQPDLGSDSVATVAFGGSQPNVAERRRHARARATAGDQIRGRTRRT